MLDRAAGATDIRRWRQLSLTSIPSPSIAQARRRQARGRWPALAPTGRQVERQDAAAPRRAPSGRAPTRRRRASRNRRSRSGVPQAPGASAFDAIEPVAEDRRAALPPRARDRAGPPDHRARPQGRRPACTRAPMIGRRSARSRIRRRVEAQQPRPSARNRARPVGRKILRRRALENRLRLLELLVGLQRAVERRHRDGGVAAAQNAVGEFPDRRDHARRPHRLSYWTKSGRRLRACSAPMRLLEMPPR